MFDNMPSFEESASQVKKFKPDVIFDDYIQLIAPDKKITERRLQLEKIVNDLVELSKSDTFFKHHRNDYSYDVSNAFKE